MVGVGRHGEGEPMIATVTKEQRVTIAAAGRHRKAQGRD